MKRTRAPDEEGAASEAAPAAGRPRATSGESSAGALSVAAPAAGEASAGTVAASSAVSAASSLPRVYRPGCLLFQDKVLAHAKRVAAECNADFIDVGAARRAKAAVSALSAARLKLVDAQRSAAVAAASAAAGASGAGGAAGAAAAAAAAAAASSAAVAARAEADNAAAAMAGSFRASLADMLLRVTLTVGASDINERIAAGGGGGESEVALVQAPPQRCTNCGNADEALFVDEYASGDVICAACGAVALEHAQFAGDWTRSFEGEEQTSQIGPRPDPLLSTRYNLRTGMAPAPGVSMSRLRELRLAQDFVEMNQSSFGAGDVVEHRTREGYKDKQKRKAFDRLEQVAERLRISEATLARAQAIFAAFRDNREHMQKFDESVAACKFPYGR